MQAIAQLAGTIVQLSDKVDNLSNKINSLENRFDKLEARFDNLETRFEKLEGRFDNLENFATVQFERFGKGSSITARDTTVWKRNFSMSAPMFPICESTSKS